MKQEPIWTNEEIINAMADARADERERCAQVVEDHRGKGDYIAAAIRARKD